MSKCCHSIYLSIWKISLIIHHIFQVVFTHLNNHFFVGSSKSMQFLGFPKRESLKNNNRKKDSVRANQNHASQYFDDEEEEEDDQFQPAGGNNNDNFE